MWRQDSKTLNSGTQASDTLEWTQFTFCVYEILHQKSVVRDTQIYGSQNIGGSPELHVDDAKEGKCFQVENGSIRLHDLADTDRAKQSLIRTLKVLYWRELKRIMVPFKLRSRISDSIWHLAVNVHLIFRQFCLIHYNNHEVTWDMSIL